MTTPYPKWLSPMREFVARKVEQSPSVSLEHLPGHWREIAMLCECMADAIEAKAK